MWARLWSRVDDQGASFHVHGYFMVTGSQPSGRANLCYAALPFLLIAISLLKTLTWKLLPPTSRTLPTQRFPQYFHCPFLGCLTLCECHMTMCTSWIPDVMYQLHDYVHIFIFTPPCFSMIYPFSSQVLGLFLRLEALPYTVFWKHTIGLLFLMFLFLCSLFSDLYLIFIRVYLVLLQRVK